MITNKHIKKNRLTTLLKYPGGKESELKYIHYYFPDIINNYYEPFLGGGAVYLSVNAEKYFVNDKSSELMNFYYNIKNQSSDFINKLEAINYNWKLITEITYNHEDELIEIYLDYFEGNLNDVEISNLLVEFVVQNTDEFNGLLSNDFNCDIENFITILRKTLLRKFKRMKKISLEKKNLSKVDISSNIESALKASFYSHLRNIYNNKDIFSISNDDYAAIYYFIRQMCYSSMFRYNKDGCFNVPYGGISYNRKSFDKNIEYFKSVELLSHFKNTIFENEDFYDFMLKYPSNKNDFIFLDPPYDSEFSTYSNNLFGSSDQERLAKYLINECEANFMLVIKNTELISSLYIENIPTANGKKIKIFSFEKNYNVSFKNRNNKEAEHLIIINY